MNTASIHFAIHCLIALAALAMLGFAFSQPLANLTIGLDDGAQVSYDIYITKECTSISIKGIAKQTDCGELKPVFKPHMQAIMGIVIALMACIVLEFVSMRFGGSACHIFGILVFGLAIALIVLVSLVSSFNAGTNYNDDKFKYKLTNTSIGVLIVASLLVLFELCCNKLVHRVVMAPYRMISGKKA